MEDSLGLAFLALAALVVGIVALAKLSHFGASIEELKRRLSKLEGRDETAAPEPIATKSAVPPPLPDYVAQQPKVANAPATVSAKPDHVFNWESILGVKLFAWIGGFAFFLGIVFFVKYAFDNNWITPAMRVVAGAIVGIASIAISLLPRVRRYRIPAQSVCATGILILYADTYAAHAFYNLIPLTLTTALMWILTGGAFFLAHYLQSQGAAWLAVIGGFVTPFLFRSSYSNSWFVFVYLTVLDCAIAALAAVKRWNHLILLAAIGSVAVEVPRLAQEHYFAGATCYPFFGLQLLFLVICAVLARSQLDDIWTIAAAAIPAWVALLVAHPEHNLNEFAPLIAGWHWHDLHVLKVPLSVAGVIALGTLFRKNDRRQRAMALVVGVALALTGLKDWGVWQSNFGEFDIVFVCGALTWYVALFVLFASTPYFCGTQRVWPWVIAALAGPLQFAFAYQFQYGTGHGGRTGFEIAIDPCIPRAWTWLMTLAFAIPAAIGVWYLIKKEQIELASGDWRLATQGAAVLAFVSLVFPVQFHREWITLGWAIEGLGLILLFHWIPNRRLRIVALIVLAGAFVRLALNPAVLEYHKRTQTPIWNWYLYAYGIAAVCFFLGAHWFGEPREKWYERKASAFLYSMSGIVLFLLMNIEIADYFSIGPTLTFSFSGNFARDMTYTIAWSLFAFGLLVFGIRKTVRAVRLVGIALLLVAFAKLFLHDLDSLEQLYRIGAFITVAVIAIVASFVYQRFLLPRTKT